MKKLEEPNTWKPQAGDTPPRVTNPLTREQVEAAAKGLVVKWSARAHRAKNKDEIDGLVESVVMYQLLRDQAQLLLSYIERIQ